MRGSSEAEARGAESDVAECRETRIIAQRDWWLQSITKMSIRVSPTTKLEIVAARSQQG